VKANNVSSAIE